MQLEFYEILFSYRFKMFCFSYGSVRVKRNGRRTEMISIPLWLKAFVRFTLLEFHCISLHRIEADEHITKHKTAEQQSTFKVFLIFQSLLLTLLACLVDLCSIFYLSLQLLR